MIETDKPILDSCCGSRMFWKNRHNPNVLYVDNRILKCKAIWKSRDGKSVRYCTVEPDIVADFTALPFAYESFVHVVFDPPHLVNIGERSWMANKYGKLDRYEWPKTIRRGPLWVANGMRSARDSRTTDDVEGTVQVLCEVQ